MGSSGSPIPRIWHEYHLFIEDELFAYSIEKSWPLPGHYLQGLVIFGVQPLSDCSLVRELGSFWREWVSKNPHLPSALKRTDLVFENNCTITKRDDGEICVLQTLPGIHLRLRKAQLDYQAALGYYRNIVEAHASNTLNDTFIKDILGLGEDYNALYENTLRLIPDSTSELRDIDWENPIGKGNNGAVYAATWHRRESVLSTSKSGDIPVVLKDVIPRGSHDATEKFMKEARDKETHARGHLLIK